MSFIVDQSHLVESHYCQMQQLWWKCIEKKVTPQIGFWRWQKRTKISLWFMNHIHLRYQWRVKSPTSVFKNILMVAYSLHFDSNFTSVCSNQYPALVQMMALSLDLGGLCVHTREGVGATEGERYWRRLYQGRHVDSFYCAIWSKGDYS